MRQLWRDIPFLVWFSLTVLLISFFVVSYWLARPYNIITVLEKPKICSPAYAGEKMFYKFNIIKNYPFPAQITTQIINDYSIKFPISYSNLPVGANKGIADLDLPSFVPSGKARLSITYQWFNVNPVRDVTTRIESEPFEIINRQEEEYKAKEKNYKAQKGQVEQNRKNIKGLDKKIDKAAKDKKPTYSIFSK